MELVGYEECIVHTADNHRNGDNNSNCNDSTTFHCEEFKASAIDVALSSLTARPPPASSIVSLPTLSSVYFPAPLPPR